MLPADIPTGPSFGVFTHWERPAAQSCIYGADQDPLAGEPSEGFALADSSREALTAFVPRV